MAKVGIIHMSWGKTDPKHCSVRIWVNIQTRNEGNNTLDNNISDSRYKYIEEWFMLFNHNYDMFQKRISLYDHFHNE